VFAVRSSIRNRYGSLRQSDGDSWKFAETDDEEEPAADGDIFAVAFASGRLFSPDRASGRKFTSQSCMGSPPSSRTLATPQRSSFGEGLVQCGRSPFSTPGSVLHMTHGKACGNTPSFLSSLLDANSTTLWEDSCDSDPGAASEDDSDELSELRVHKLPMTELYSKLHGWRACDDE
jgi:hypothetical protein